MLARETRTRPLTCVERDALSVLGYLWHVSGLPNKVIARQGPSDQCTAQRRAYRHRHVVTRVEVAHVDAARIDDQPPAALLRSDVTELESDDGTAGRDRLVIDAAVDVPHEQVRVALCCSNVHLKYLMIGGEKVGKRRAVADYYMSFGSRYGYQWVLGGTKHFGIYQDGDSRWRFSDAMRRMEDLLAVTLNLPRGSSILDAGCGVGDVAYRLASVYGYPVTGIDILESNIPEAQRRAAHRAVTDMTTFCLMSYYSLTFDADSFDGVFTMETLVHAEDVPLVLSNLFDVLKPGVAWSSSNTLMTEH